MADHLTERKGYWHFQRRVPKEYIALDPSGVIRHSIKISVKEDRRGIKAGKIADAMNRELEAYWRSLSEGNVQKAQDHYNEYRRLTRSPLGFDYAETSELANRSTLKRLERLEKLMGYEKSSSKSSEVFSKDENQARSEVKDISPKQIKRSKKDFKGKLIKNKQRRKKNKQPANKQIAVQPIEPILVNNLVGLAKAYAKAKGVKITTVGTNSTKTALFYVNLENGTTSCTLRKYDMLTKWFAFQNWPKGHTMPTLKDPQHYPNPEGK